MKRLFDFVFGTTFLIVALPLIAIVSVAISVLMRRPIFFRQERPGLHGKPFHMLKFRTMSDARGDDGALLPDAERLGSLGSFLRRFSLDELPELWNVVKGDMSLVGPRPLLMEYLPLYNDSQSRRHDVRPGVTGWAQVRGRNALTWEEKFELDVWYVDNQSLFLDVKILFMTIRQVLRPAGVSMHGYATMPKFEGTKD